METNSCDHQPVWNASALDKQVGQNAALQARLLAKFLLGSSLQVTELTEAANKGQCDKVAQIAHQLKASARSVGAMQLGESCQFAEAAGHAGHTHECQVLVTHIQERYAEVSQIIRESLD